MKRLHHHRDHGFSLIVCLIILTLLSILVVSFITTTTSERTTSKAYLNKATAELAANTAVNQAISLLTEQIAQYPDSATVWDSVVPPKGTKPADDLPVEGTYLYYTTTGPNFSSGTTTGTPRPARVLPLFSRSKGGEAITDDVEITAKNTVLGTEAWNDTTSVNLNRARDDKDSDGWIGSPPTATPAPGPGAVATPTPKPFRAKWIEIKDQAPLASGTPIPGTPTPKVIGRYAYWVEDESFKVNLNLLRNGKRGNEMDIKDPITGVVSVKGEWTLDAEALAQQFYKDHPERASDWPAWHTPIQGLVRSARAPFMGDGAALDSIAGVAYNLRNDFFGKQLFEFRAFNRADSSLYLLADRTKFLATIFSGGLNLSRLGTQRVNLNALVGLDEPGHDPEKTDYKADFYPQPSSSSDSSISTEEKQVRQIVQTIRYHAPKFGQRFYRFIDPDNLTSEAGKAPIRNAESGSASVSTAHQNIYLHKVAANIRDYIDPDSQPTIVRDPDPENASATKWGIVPARSAPPFAMKPDSDDGPNPYWAQGKDGAPFLQEAVVRIRTRCDNSTKRYELYVDYYLEFWNMTDTDIYAVPQTDSEGKPDLTKRYLGGNPYVKIAESFGWKGHGGAQNALKADNSPPGNPGPNDVHDMVIYLGNRPGQQDIFQPRGAYKSTGVIFKANSCTVVTTDPDAFPPLPPGTTADNAPVPESSTNGGVNPANTYFSRNIVGKRYFTGPVPSDSDGIWADWRDAVNNNGVGGSSKGSSDYMTQVILANDYGYIDSNPFAIASTNPNGVGPYVTYLTGDGGRATARDDSYGGTLLGNGNTVSQLGDPRTNNEQLYFTRYKTGSLGEPDVTRYFNPSNENYRFSLGYPNSRYVFPYLNAPTATKNPAFGWKDYYKGWSQTVEGTPNGQAPQPKLDSDNAPMFVGNRRMRSIGQLGDVFDPARIVGTKGSGGVTGSRGGGRTFKVGQPDNLVDMTTANAVSQQWASWRLTDMFSTTSNMVLPGLININGLLRDNGAALRAACYGMTLNAVYQDSSAVSSTVNKTKTLDSTENASVGIQQVVNLATARLKETDPNKPSYFRERGELSQLDLFGTSTKLVLGMDMKIAFDRTREEVVRRLIDMTTTRGSVFSVYAVGQSINQGKDGVKRVTGEHWVKTTFALLPRDAAGNAFEPGVQIVNGEKVPAERFNPIDETQVNQRFAKPDHYDIQLLQVSPL